MKLHTLKLTNLASLKGTHVLNLDEGLAGESLFAITGPTGSGKSTLLTALSLALYGSTHKKTLSQHDFVTLGEREGQVELLFSAAGTQYLAYWECRVRKANGEKRKNPLQRRLLFKVVNGKQEALESTAEDVLQLTFDQFCKTVILNQGEFSRFLSSSFTERKEILERLYQGGVLSLLSKILKEELTELQQQHNLSSAELKGLDEFTVELITELEKNVLLQQQQSTLLQERIVFQEEFKKQIRDLYQVMDKSHEFLEKKKASEQELQLATSEFNKSKQDLETLSRQQKKTEQQFKTRIPILRQLLQDEKKCEDLDKRLKQKNTEQQQQVKELSQQQQKIEEVIHRYSLLHQELSSIQYPAAEFDKLYPVYLQAEPFLEAEKGYQEKKRLLSQQLQKLKEAIQQKNHQATELKKPLSHPVLPEKLEANKDQLITSFEKAKILLLQKIDFQAKKDQKLKQKQKLELSIQDSKKNLATITTLLEKIEKNIQLNHLLESVHFCQVESHKKDHCLVCHQPLPSTFKVQPLASESQQTELLDYQKQKQQCEQDLFKQQSEFSLLQKEIKSLNLTTELPAVFQEVQSLEELTQNYRQKLSVLEEQLKQKKQWELQEQERQTRLMLLQENQLIQMKEEKALAQSLTALEQELREGRLQQDQLSQQASRFTTYAALSLSQLSELLRKHYELSQKQASLQSQKKLLLEQQQSLQEGIQRTQQSVLALSEDREKLQAELKLLTDQLSYHRKEVSFQQELNECEQQQESLSKALKELTQKHHQREVHQKELEVRHRYIVDQLSDLKLQQNALQQSIGQLALTELKSPLTAPLKSKLEKLIHPPTSSFSVFLTALSHLKHDQETFLKGLQEQRQKKEQNLAVLQDRLKIGEEKLQLKQEQEKKLQHQQVQLQRLSNLSLLVGKDEFRNFALGLVEKRLILQANQELATFCDGRYELVHRERRKNSQLQDFYVLDHFKGGMERKVSTLSGGETFLVSLAMALGLSEMTRGQAEIDSFFIDEGFGSLDQDSLEDVIEVLYSVRSRGKIVGIISHVSSLTSRLPVNIQLRKNQLGESSFSLIYN